MADEIDIPFTWLDQPDDTDEFARYTARLDALLKPHFEEDRAAAQSREIEQSFKDAGFQPGDILTPENSKEFIAIASRRLTTLAFRQPYEETLRAGRIAELLAVDLPSSRSVG